jgi:hypothetical protein
MAQLKPRSLARLLFGALLSLGHPALAYDLFHPVPADKMPELNPDRPDKTNSSVTVPAGHWQLEGDLAIVSRDQADGLRTEDWSNLDFMLRVGLAEGFELELSHAPLLRGSAEDLVTGDTADQSGHGDLNVGFKLTLSEAKGLRPGVGLIPFVKFPTATEGLGNGQTEGGLGIPVGWELPHDWELGTMLELDVNANSQASGRHVDSSLSASASHSIWGPLGGYLELWGQLSGEQGVNGQATFDTGLTCNLGESAQVDLGANVGLNDTATDLEPFVGMTYRL